MTSTSLLFVCLLSVVVLFGATAESKMIPNPYGHVVVVGIDGVRVDVLRDLVANNTMPNMASLRESGAHTDSCRSVQPSMSLPNWGGMMYGAGPEFTGVHTNGWERHTAEVFPIEGRCWQWPSLFSVARNQFSGMHTSMFYSWSPIAGLLSPGLSDSVNHHRFEECGGCATCGIVENATTDAFIENMRVNRSRLSFLYYNVADDCGHENGVNGPEYHHALQLVDGWIGRVRTALRNMDIMKDTLFLIVTDHGRSAGSAPGDGGGHGSFRALEQQTQWLAYSERGDIKAGHCIRWPVSITDTAPTALYALGISQLPIQWRGRPVLDVFADQPAAWVFRNWHDASVAATCLTQPLDTIFQCPNPLAADPTEPLPGYETPCPACAPCLPPNSLDPARHTGTQECPQTAGERFLIGAFVALVCGLALYGGYYMCTKHVRITDSGDGEEDNMEEDGTMHMRTLQGRSDSFSSSTSSQVR